MARTKSEVRAFLNSQVGQSVNAKSGVYKGQCVSLIKALFEFLGVPDPYSARGNAITVNDTLLRQGIGTSGKGWLTVVVNRDMGYIDGVHYGHIWIDLAGEANYEQNGNRALYTTKNTRPISQGQQFVNLDKWIQEDNMPAKSNLATARQLAYDILGRDGRDGSPNAMAGQADGDLNKNHAGADLTVGYINTLFDSAEAQGARRKIDKAFSDRDTYKKQVTDLNNAVQNANADRDAAKRAQIAAEEAAAVAQVKLEEAEKALSEAKAEDDADKAAADTFMRRFGQWLKQFFGGN